MDITVFRRLTKNQEIDLVRIIKGSSELSDEGIYDQLNTKYFKDQSVVKPWCAMKLQYDLSLGCR